MTSPTGHSNGFVMATSSANDSHNLFIRLASIQDFIVDRLFENAHQWRKAVADSGKKIIEY